MQWESFVWTSYPIPTIITADVSVEQSLIKKKLKEKKDKIKPNNRIKCDLQGEVLKVTYVNNKFFLL